MIQYVWRYVQDIFELVDFHRDLEVRNFFTFLPQLDMFMDLYIFALAIKEDFFSF